MKNVTEIRPWLVQRGKFRTNDSRKVTGIDSLIDYDYMGSAEFEFGGLGKSLRRIVAVLPEYSAANTNIKAHDDRALILFCRQGAWAATCQAINDIIAGKVRLKERAQMAETIVKPKRYTERTEFWWDIGNDWMAWLGDKRTALVTQALRCVNDTV